MMSPTPPANRDDPEKDGEQHDVGSMETPQYIINAGSSSDSENSDEDDTSYQGYQLLPQDPDGSVVTAVPTADSVAVDTSEPGHSDPALSHTAQARAAGAAAGDHRLQEKMSQLGDDQVDKALKKTLQSESHFVSLGQGASLFQMEKRTPEARERRDLWQKFPKSSGSTTQTMPQADVEQIKAAMAGFTLPTSHTPSWVWTVPEEEWKSQLMGRMTVDASHSSDQRADTDRRKSDGAQDSWQSATASTSACNSRDKSSEEQTESSQKCAHDQT